MTYEHPIKHIPCGLHFLVLSWNEKWTELPGEMYCPECGGTEGFIIWEGRETKDHIFEIVPGPSKLIAMNA